MIHQTSEGETVQAFRVPAVDRDASGAWSAPAFGEDPPSWLDDARKMRLVSAAARPDTDRVSWVVVTLTGPQVAEAGDWITFREMAPTLPELPLVPVLSVWSDAGFSAAHEAVEP